MSALLCRWEDGLPCEYLQARLEWGALDQAFFEATEVVLDHAGPRERCNDIGATIPRVRSAIGCLFFEVVEVVSERCGSETLCSAIGMVLPAMRFDLDHTLSEEVGVVCERSSSGTQGAAV
jgi:hypothetical protein